MSKKPKKTDATLNPDFESTGFRMEKHPRHPAGYAAISLELALRAYVATYSAIGRAFRSFATDKERPAPEELRFNTSLDYVESCVETVVHFQHFFELVIKEELRNKHELLASDAIDDALVLDDLLSGKAPKAEPKSVEFSRAFGRYCALVQAGRIGNDLKMLCDKKEALSRLNTLRNRFWHRGVFVLWYDELDKFVAADLLPLVIKITSNTRFSNLRRRFPAGVGGLHPLTEIVKAAGSRIDLKRIAFFKELARASYANPIVDESKEKIKYFKEQNDLERSRAVAAASAAHADGYGAAEVRECPVCRTESLVVYEDSESEDTGDQGEPLGKRWDFTYEIRCFCCGLSMDQALGNPREHGLKKVPDFWTVREY